MTSKEALEELRCVLVSNQGTKKYSDIFEENLLRPIEKDLDLLEKYRKAEKEIGVDFITLAKMLKDDDYINRMNKEASPHTIEWEVEERKD